MLLPDLWLDVRLASRVLVRHRLVAVVVVLSLALGIGANAVIFSLVNALLLRPLPVPQPDRLVRIGRTVQGEGFDALSFAEFQVLREGAPALAEVLAHQPNDVVVSVDGEPLEEAMEIVSESYFRALGLALPLGSGFAPAEGGAAPGGDPVAVISDQLWRRRFGADPDVVGRPVKVNGHPFTVAGVAPPAFRGTFAGIDVALWLPLRRHAQILPDEPALDDPQYRFLMVIARLGDRATRSEVAAQLATVATRLGELPGAEPEVGLTMRAASGVHPFLARVVRAFLILLMVIVGLVLAVACANVANLLLARATARRQEMAVRRALGASRGRVVRQLLVESLALAGLGGVGGLIIALWSSRVLGAFRPSSTVPIALDVSPDWRVFGFTALVAAGTGVLFGLAPALHASGVRLSTALRTEAGGRRGSFVRHGLVVAQVAVTTVLLVGAVLLARSLANSRTLDPGFDARNIYVVATEPGRLGYTGDATRTLWERITSRLAALPGVRDVALGLFVPMGDRADQLPILPGERTFAEEPAGVWVDYSYVGPAYFRTLGIPLLAGRAFREDDAREAPPVAIVNETLAREFWPDGDPLGRGIRIRDREGRERVVDVVGMARNIKYRSPGEPPLPFLYLPHVQWDRPDLLVHLRVAEGAGPGLVPAIRAQIHAEDPELPVDVTAMEDAMAFSLVPVRLAAAVLGFAGALGLLLAAIGLFGVMSYAVARRTREIGIRMALGARAGQVRRMVIGNGVRLAITGLVLGLPVALLGTRLLGWMLYEVSPRDPLTLVGIVALLTLVALAAAYVPARRATRIDPAVVMREE